MIRTNRLRELVYIHRYQRFHARGQGGMLRWFVRHGLVDYSGLDVARLTERGERAMYAALAEYRDKGRLYEAFPPTYSMAPKEAK